jgi:uncharacterized protein GlcG (DUF336 family)
LLLSAVLIWGYGNPHATTSGIPKIDRNQTVLKSGKKQLLIVGQNFDPSTQVVVQGAKGTVTSGTVSYQSSSTIVVNGVTKKDFPDGVATITMTDANGNNVQEKLAVIPSAIGPSPLTEDDIRQIIGQGIAAAQSLGKAATFAVLDREGNILALYRMNGATPTVTVQDFGTPGQGLEALGGPNGLNGTGIAQADVKSEIACISKAGTGAFLSTFGNAFSTRTAAYIIREHIPPFIKNMPSGPLFGVQISSLGCSDVKQPGLPLGMSGDAGGIPIYKNGFPSGGLGVEINGEYNVCRNSPTDIGTPVTPNDELYEREELEEIVAFAAQRGFEAPDAITADKILVNGIRLMYRRTFDIPQVQAVSLESAGHLLPIPPLSTNPDDVRIRTGVPTEFRDIVLEGRNVRVVNRFFPFKDGTLLSAANAEQIIVQGVAQANRTRAAIRRPIEVAAEVNVSLEDVDGSVLGIASTPDAPIFGFDVAVEKGRSAIFFSRPDAGNMLKKAGLGKYVDQLFSEGIRLDGNFVFTSRSIGFIHRPYFPDDIDGTKAGPLSTPISDFSPLNNGFQTDYLLQGANGMDPYQLHKGKEDLSFVIGRSIVNVSAGILGTPDTFFCDATNGGAENLLNNTLMIFSGSSPVAVNGQLAGSTGISGDGIDQDDIIGSYGSKGFEVPPAMRCDRFFMRGIRIPYTHFPRHPNLGGE